MSGLLLAAPLLVDCDTGIDDSAALVYLLQRSANIVAITSCLGNTSAEQAAANTAALLRSSGRSDIPVTVGSERRFDGSMPPYSLAVHGAAGTGDVVLLGGDVSAGSAVDTIVQAARRYPGELNILATGALTNLALALDIEPSLPKLIHSVTVMGGAALVPGNVTPVAEANVERDPEAAARVFASGLSITLVPLDVTMDHVLDDAQRQRLAESDSEATRLVAQMLDSYMDFYISIYGRKCAPLHDALAAAIAIGDIVPAVAPLASVVIDTSGGPGRGQTVVDLRNRFTAFAPPTGATRIVLTTDEPFVPLLIDTLLSS